MNTGPLLLEQTPMFPVIRLWDHDWNMCHVLPPDQPIGGPGRRRFLSFPVEHVVARWISDTWNATTGHHIYVTDERDGQHWVGCLDAWKIERNGPCRECAHCNQKIMHTAWMPIPAS